MGSLAFQMLQYNKKIKINRHAIPKILIRHDNSGCTTRNQHSEHDIH